MKAIFNDATELSVQQATMKGWYNIIRDRKEGKGWQNKADFLTR